MQARLQKHTGFVRRNVGTVAHWLGSLCEHVRTKVDKGLNGFVDIIHDYVKFGPHHGLASVVDFYQDSRCPISKSFGGQLTQKSIHGSDMMVVVCLYNTFAWP